MGKIKKMTAKEVEKVKQETVNLLKLYKESKDYSYRDRIVELNMNLLTSEAKKIYKDYAYTGVTEDDLISAGSLGLMRAVENFDMEKGTSFSSYAIPCIHDYMMETVTKFNDHSKNFYVTRKSILEEQEKLKKKLGRMPTEEEIAKSLGNISTSKVSDILSNLNPTVFWDDTHSFDDDNQGDVPSLENIVSDNDSETPEQIADKKSSYEMLIESLEILSKNERYVIVKYYDIDHTGNTQTLEEIGNDLHVTKQRVHQLLNSALKKLKGEVNKKLESNEG